MLSLVGVFFLMLFSGVSAVQNIKVQGADYVNNVTSDRFQIIGIAWVTKTQPHCPLLMFPAINQEARLASLVDPVSTLLATEPSVYAMLPSCSDWASIPSVSITWTPL